MQRVQLLPDLKREGQLPSSGRVNLKRPNFVNSHQQGNQIGSQRRIGLNPSLKNSNQDGNSDSISCLPCFQGMSVAQLRIEDYYLIRTRGLNSTQQNWITKLIENSCFNLELIQNTNCKDIVNGEIKNSEDRQRIQTVDKRLHMVNVVIPQLKSSKNRSLQAANLPIGQSQIIKTQVAVPTNLQIQLPLARDQQFKDYYQRQLSKLTEKQNIRQILQYYLDKELRQRVGDFKPINSEEELIRQYREIMQMRAILEQFRADQYRRVRANALNQQDKIEAQKIWASFLEIYSQKLMNVYNHYHSRITADILKQFVAEIKNKELQRLFQIKNQTSPEKKAQIINRIKQQNQNYNTMNTAQQLSSLWSNAKQISIANEIENIRTLKLKLQALSQRQRVERQFHLYDVINNYQNIGNIDDYVKPKKEYSTTVIVIDKRQQKNNHKNVYRRSKVNTVKDAGSQVRQFLPLQSRIDGKLSPLVIVYVLRVVWAKQLNNVYKQLKGSIQLPRQSMTNFIYQSLEAKIRKQQSLIVKSDARFQFFELNSTSRVAVYNLQGNIWQQIINLPNDYKYTYKQIDKLIAEELVVQNHFGKMQWQQKVDLEGIDFKMKGLRIEQNLIECEPEGLNRKCLVTFKSMPANIIKVKIQQGTQAAEKLLRKICSKFQGCRLQHIQWGSKPSYTLFFKDFGKVE